MRFRNLSLGFKLNIALLVFLLVLGAATSAIVFYGFSRTKDNANDRSREALEEEGKLALEAFAGGIADSGALQLEYAAEVGQRASRYLNDFKASGGTAPVDTSRFVQKENGVWYDPDPDRVSDVVVVNHAPALEGGVLDDITFSAPLDMLFPALANGFPGQLSEDAFLPTNISFIGLNGVGRIYPALGTQENIDPEIDLSDFFDGFGTVSEFEGVGSVSDPNHESHWTSPYEDINGEGLVISAVTPLYEGDVFRGGFEVDISIDKLVETINTLKPTENGFTFYVDVDGEILRTDAYDLLTSEAEDNDEFAAVLQSMRTSEVGSPITIDNVSLNGEEYFIAHSPLSPIGGSFGVAAPIAEVTANAAIITAGVNDDANRTLWIMLGVMGGLLVVGLVGAGYVNRRVVVGPIQRLAAATEKVAGGDLETNVVVDRDDELGALAGSFNVMVDQIRESERNLERRVEERTRELEALLEVARQIAAEITMTDLAETLVRVASELFESTSVSVSAYPEESKAVHLASTNTMLAEDGVTTGTTYDISRPTPIWEQLKQGKGLLIDDVRGESELAAAYRVVVGDALDGVFRDVRSWMAVPLEVNDRVIGSMVVTHSEPNRYTANDLRVATAMASQAAVALENARLFDESKLRTQELDALLRADAELFRSLNLDEVLQALVDVAVDVLGVDKSMVTLFDRERGEVRVRAARNLSEETIQMFQAILTQPGPRNLPDDFEIAIHGEQPGDTPPELQEISDREGVKITVEVPVKSATTGVLGGFALGYTSEHRVTEDEKRLFTALADRAAVAISNAELYARAEDAASLEERQRLARELHDSVSQALYGIALGARTAREQLDRDPAKAAEPVDYVLSLAEAGLAEMRALIFELRPGSLATEGLVAALEKQVAATQARFGVEVEGALCEEPDVPIETKEAFYRIGQEALHNVVKHARAQHAWLSLTEEDGALTLEIRDDGVGFDPNAEYPGHLGLQSMRERASNIGALLSFESSLGSGTSVRVRMTVSAE